MPFNPPKITEEDDEEDNDNFINVDFEWTSAFGDNNLKLPHTIDVEQWSHLFNLGILQIK